MTSLACMHAAIAGAVVASVGASVVAVVLSGGVNAAVAGKTD